jgi:hypothetical protein
MAAMKMSTGWDLELAEDDSLSRNPALRLQQASNLLQLGVFNDPATGQPDMRAFRRAAGLRLPGVGPDLVGSEHAYAASIPQRLEANEAWQPRPWDDARVVAEELMGWLRGEGRSAPEELVQRVGQVWIAYAQSLMQSATPSDAQIMPNSMQTQQQAPPGNQAGGISQGAPMTPPRPPPSSSDAQVPEPGQVVAEADNAGERLARPGPRHEG